MADDDFDIYGDDEAYESVREVSSTASFDFDFECQLIPLAASNFINVLPVSPKQNQEPTRIQSLDEVPKEPMLGDKRSREDDDHSGPATLPPNLRNQPQAQNGPPPALSQPPQRPQNFPVQGTQQNMISSAGNMSLSMPMGMGGGTVGMNMGMQTPQGLQKQGGPMDALYIVDLQWVRSVILQGQCRHSDRYCSSGRPMKQ